MSSNPAAIEPVSRNRPFPFPSIVPKVDELLASASRPLFSFEFFPPATAEAEATLWRTIRELEALAPDFISVTYGASGSTRDRTINVTRRISEETTLRTMGHLTVVSQSRQDVRRVVGAYADAGVRHILAVRGDPPGGPTAPWVQHPEGLRNATELVRLVSSLGDFCIGVAAFPDVHPEKYDAELDARILVDKAEAGAAFAITQLFFDPNSYFELVERVRSHGCDLPIIPGIQPVTNLKQIERFAELSGADLPPALVARLRTHAGDPASVRAIGIEVATQLCEELLDGGAPGLHYFTLNRSPATRAIYANLQASRPLSRKLVG
ncbi:MAG: methylenetetrahydrofolate reductase [NAD(P)H] [Propionibacteriaceae bacterium]|nr:methylenetetrahydrofolate reductase [NAD(P)H] [Propionibacteriaceae bacterium]